MWDFLNKGKVEGKRLHCKMPTEPTGRQPQPTTYFITKKQILPRHSLRQSRAQDYVKVGETVVDCDRIEQRLNHFIHNKNMSELSPTANKRFGTPQCQRLPVIHEDELRKKASAPAWMKNPKRLMGLPTIDVKFNQVAPKNLNGFTVSITPVTMQKSVYQRNSPINRQF